LVSAVSSLSFLCLSSEGKKKKERERKKKKEKEKEKKKEKIQHSPPFSLV